MSLQATAFKRMLRLKYNNPPPEELFSTNSLGSYYLNNQVDSNFPFNTNTHFHTKFNLYDDVITDFCPEADGQILHDSAFSTIYKTHNPMVPINQNDIHKRCKRKKCFPCKFRNSSSVIRCSSSNFSIYPRHNRQITCDDKNLVYCINCSHCNYSYIGKTSNSLRTRFYLHGKKFLAKGDDNVDLQCVHKHFLECAGNPQVSILAKVDNSADLGRVESDLMLACRTVFPFGLNDSHGAKSYVASHVDTNVFEKFLEYDILLKAEKRCGRKRGNKNSDTGNDIFDVFQYIVEEIPQKLWLQFFRRIVFSARLVALKELAILISNKPLFLDSCYHARAAILDLIKTRITPSKKAPKRVRKDMITINFCDKDMNHANLEGALKSFPCPTGAVGVCYKYKDTMRSQVFNYGKFVRTMHDKKHSCFCNNFTEYHYYENGHIATGDLSGAVPKILADADQKVVNNLLKILNCGPRYRCESPEFNDSNHRYEHFSAEIQKSIKNFTKLKGNQKKSKIDHHKLENWMWEVVKETDQNLQNNFHSNRTRPNLKAELKLLKKLQRHFVFSYIDKCASNVSIVCKKHYCDILNNEVNKKEQYTEILKTEAEVIDSLKKSIDTITQGYVQADGKLPILHMILKMHKKGRRFICSNTPNTINGNVACALTNFLKVIYNSRHCFERTAHEVFNKPRAFFTIENSDRAAKILANLKEVKNFGSIDFSALYDNIDPKEASLALSTIIKETFGNRQYLSLKKGSDCPQWSNTAKPDHWNVSAAKLIELLNFVLFNQYVKVGNKIFKQTRGVPMGSSPAPYIANLFLFSKEKVFVRNNPSLFPKDVNVFRYLDDVLYINIDYPAVAASIYGQSLPFTRDDPKFSTLAFLDLNVHLRDGKFDYFTHDKRDDYQFKVNKYPYAHSTIHLKTLVGVGVSQLVRCQRTNSTFHKFVSRSANVLSEVLCNGGSPSVVKNIWNSFRKKHYDASIFKVGPKICKTTIFDMVFKHKH